MVEKNDKDIIIKTGGAFSQILSMKSLDDENRKSFKPFFEIGTIFYGKRWKKF